jgi:hypothetical protein
MPVTSTARATEADAGHPASDAAAAPTGSRTERLLARLWARLRPARADWAICLAFLLLAAWITHGLWPDPATRTLALNPEDQTLYEWFLAVDSRVLHGDFALLTRLLNAPDGVNLMVNTSVIALGALFSPITLVFGSPTTFALLVTLNLGVTAIAFYLLFRRVLKVNRVAATIGGGFCGFAPGEVSQSNSHLHMTALWLVPVMVWLVVRLVRAADPHDGGYNWRRVATSGVGLAATVTVQAFVGEEILFLSALTLAVMAVVYALARPVFALRALPGFLAGMALAVGLAVVALARPLAFQFSGPQSVPNGVFSPDYFSADLASFPAVSPLSLAGSDESARLSTGPAEYNTFLGWPLLIVAAACTLWLIRRPIVFACAAAGLVMAGFSLGPTVVVNGTRTDITGPYQHLIGYPVIDGALPMRFALALIPLVATVLAVAVDHGMSARWKPARTLVPLLVVAALVPIFPTPLPATARPPVPTFISSGAWRDCVKPGGVMVPVPPATPKDPWPMRWAAATDASFGIPEGFFIAPYGSEGRASMGTYQQPTSQLLAQAEREGKVPGIGDAQRQQAQKDIDFWGASCVVLVAGATNYDTLLASLEALFGPGTRVADAVTWKVR